MKTTGIISAFAIAALAFSAGAAEPKEAVSGAIKALKEKENYSWTTTSELANSQFPGFTTKGKTEKGGFTHLSSEGQNGEIHAYKKGEKGVLKTDEGWQTADELGQGGQGRGRFGGRLLLNARTPGDDAEELLKGTKELKAGDGGVYSGDLTDEAAKARAGFGGRRGGGGNAPEPRNAKGSVKFWVKDGMLTKYQLHSTSKMEFQGEEREFDRTATTEISNVGSTKVEVPEEAKKKL